MVRFSMLKSLSYPKILYGLLLTAAFLGAASCAHAQSAVSTPIEKLNPPFLLIMIGNVLWGLRTPRRGHDVVPAEPLTIAIPEPLARPETAS